MAPLNGGVSAGGEDVQLSVPRGSRSKAARLRGNPLLQFSITCAPSAYLLSTAIPPHISYLTPRLLYHGDQVPPPPLHPSPPSPPPLSRNCPGKTRLLPRRRMYSSEHHQPISQRQCRYLSRYPRRPRHRRRNPPSLHHRQCYTDHVPRHLLR